MNNTVVKCGLELICSASNKEAVLFNVKDDENEYILTGGSHKWVSGVNRKIIDTYEIEDIKEFKIEEIVNVNYIKKSEIITS